MIIFARFITYAVLAVILATAGAAQDQPPEPRGYLTTPGELRVIADKARAGIEPYASAVRDVLDWADRDWDYSIDGDIRCRGADDPRWLDERGAGIVYASAIAYHLTGDEAYAKQVISVIEEVIDDVEVLPDNRQQCRLNFAWGVPEYVAAADLIESYWHDHTCEGPMTTLYGDDSQDRGNCKALFQNWLVKNPYYIVSYSALAQSNWGAAATNTTAYIADYLWDRPEVSLVHRHPPGVFGGGTIVMNPAQAYAYSRQLLLDRLNGYGVEHDSSSSCDYLAGRQQDEDFPPVKSQITENGIIPEDARREQRCNIPVYNGEYQNYPQIHINNTVQQCELLLRRGDRSCYDNVSFIDIPEYTFIGPDGEEKVVHLRRGRGSVERAINAIIIDSRTQWRHDNALYVAFRYYVNNSRYDLVDQWFSELDDNGGCSQGICFGRLTHGFAPGEIVSLPPTVDPPGGTVLWTLPAHSQIVPALREN